MLQSLKTRSEHALRRYDRVYHHAKELAWMAGDFGRFRRRRMVARTLAPRLRIPKEQGFMTFDPKTFGETDGLVAAGREIYDAWSKGLIPSSIADRSKAYFHNIITPGDLIKYPAVMQFALNRDLLATLSDYFGFAPELCSVGLMLSNPVAKLAGSQHGHFDSKDSKHVKVIVAVEDVEDENGPFEFLPVKESNVVREKTGFKWGFGRRFKDASLFQIVPHSAFLKVKSRAGEGLIVDTSNCLHFGSRVESEYRLMWFVHFATFSEYQKMQYMANGSVMIPHLSDRSRFASDELTRLVLDVR